MTRTGSKWARLAALAVVGLATGAQALAAQDEPELGWFYRAELSAVLTGGNSVATTLGAGFSVRGLFEGTRVEIRGRGLRTKTGVVNRVAVGTVDDFDVERTTDTDVTAENYSLRARVERSVNDYFFYFGGVGWERNTFAGFNSRVSAVAGAGNTWLEDDVTRFKTTYGVTFTQQDDVVENPDVASTFIGARLGADFWLQITNSTAYESNLIGDTNFSDFEDLRFDWTNAVEVRISDALAFRTALQLLFDNQPSLTTVPLEQPLGTPTGETVVAALGKFDTQFTVALVADF